MKIKALRRGGETLLPTLMVAEHFSERFMGLMFKQELEANSGLLIPNCSMVHMFFMKFPLDLVFLSRESEILCLQKDLKPWHLSQQVPRARSVIEVAPGFISRHNCRIGETLEIVDSAELH